MNRAVERSMLLSVPLMLILPGCGNTLGPETEHGRVTILASTSAASVTSIALEVSGPGIDSPLWTNLTPGGGGTWEAELDVPIGANRVFHGMAYNDAAVLTHENSVTQDVVAGTNAVTIALLPVDEELGEVTIEVTLEDRDISISPASTSVDVESTQEFTATVTGSSCTVNWASSNPGLASVAADGQSDGVATATATGHVAGSVQIVANCGGMAAAATLTVD